MFTSNLAWHLPRKVISNFYKHVSSALFITADKAQETFSVLTPHLDFDEQLKNKDKLQENVKLRALNIDIHEITSLWIFYQKFLSQKVNLEEARVNISNRIKTLSPEKDKSEIDKLIVHGKMIRDDLKAMKNSFYELEEKAVTRVLSLPNIIHERTPASDQTIYMHGDIPKTKSEFHFNIAQNLDLIEYENPNIYYLKKDAALFELGSTFYITDELVSKNFIAFSNSDFTRSVVVEGCGMDYSDPNQVFTIMESDSEQKHENSRLHLTGGCSLASFMAYYTKHIVFPTQLPLKYFSTGRKYSPVSSKEKSLFNVAQETAVELFIVTKDDAEEMNSEFDKALNDIINIYTSLDYHFKVCYLPAKDLKKWESLKASIQMYSPYLEKYVEVGFLSICDNYISKRLLFNYGTGYNMNFPKIISGTVFSVPKILACIIENNSLSHNSTLLHENFKKYLS